MKLDELRYIEVETSRFCNRVCAWCPNSVTNSRREQELLPWPMLERVADALGQVQYRGWIALHNYNEPLANPRLPEELALIRARAPEARITIVTNGDTVSAERCLELAAAGVAHLRITRYPAHANGSPNSAATTRWLRVSGLHALGDWQVRPSDSGDHVLTAAVGTMSVEVISPDISAYNSRGGLLPAWNGTRAAPCEWTTYYASIDHRGRVKMCCNVVPDVAANDAYVVGSLADATLAQLLASSRLEDWSRRHLRADWSDSAVCATCRHRFRMVPGPEAGTAPSM